MTCFGTIENASVRVSAGAAAVR